MRIIFSDGQILDTSDSDAKIKFVEENRQLIVELFKYCFGSK